MNGLDGEDVNRRGGGWNGGNGGRVEAEGGRMQMEGGVSIVWSGEALPCHEIHKFNLPLQFFTLPLYHTKPLSK